MGQEVLILRIAEGEKRGYHPTRQEKRPEEDREGETEPNPCRHCKPESNQNSFTLDFYSVNQQAGKISRLFPALMNKRVRDRCTVSS